ncbi:hypothetical protein HD806DRAFT_514603 [Xylariaceae sp. AK1471]|nr:hypothetical protein HD806DRAFT_514603 [Xylariaceae sp. AK1471]
MDQTLDIEGRAAQIEVFELSPKAHPYIPVSTTKISENFTRDSPPGFHHADLLERRELQREYAETVDELRRWAKTRTRSTAMKALLRVIFRDDFKIRKPSEEKLYRCVNHYFPSRMDLTVLICDFGEGRAEQHRVRLGDIETEFQRKPDWAQVRWIHASLGVGLLSSSVEALFFHTGSKVMGRPFEKAGRAGWPYLEVETFDVRSTRSIQDARDVARILKADEGFNSALDRGVFVGDNNENLKKDLTWRASYVGLGLKFWDLANADMPWQLSEGSHLNMNGSSQGLRTTKLERVSQSLANHEFYQEVYLVRNPFRCFHRDDGYLLTMSSAAGVDYLNSNLPYYLQMSQHELHQENSASAIAQVYREFSETGTSAWHRKTVEWFLVYLMTEVGSTPHTIRQGYSVPSLTDAFDSVVHELKERRYDEWQRNETIALVRSYLQCIDDLTVLEKLFAKKLDFFQRLKIDCQNFESQDNNRGSPPDNAEGETALDRASFAEHMMEDFSTQCKRLNADLRESLHSLFQLRSIEQNELAIIADNKNKAIFVFTGVTIIFLPLSFFTSYFGMNLKGITGTDKTESCFWEVCGPISFVIILAFGTFALRYRVMELFSKFRVQRTTSVV